MFHTYIFFYTLVVYSFLLLLSFLPSMLVNFCFPNSPITHFHGKFFNSFSLSLSFFSLFHYPLLFFLPFILYPYFYLDMSNKIWKHTCLSLTYLERALKITYQNINHKWYNYFDRVFNGRNTNGQWILEKVSDVISHQRTSN